MVERRVRRVGEAGEGRLLVREQRRDEAGAGAVGVLRDAPHQRHGGERRGQHDLLPGLEAEADGDGDLRQPVQPGRVGGRGGDRVHGVTLLGWAGVRFICQSVKLSTPAKLTQAR